MLTRKGSRYVRVSSLDELPPLVGFPAIEVAERLNAPLPADYEAFVIVDGQLWYERLKPGNTPVYLLSPLNPAHILDFDDY